MHSSAEQLGQLPQAGWRVIHARPARGRLGRADMLVAPLSARDGTWALVNLAARDGGAR